MKYLIVSVLALFLTACSLFGKEPACEAGKMVTKPVAEKTAEIFTCKNLAAVQATYDKKLVDLKLCSAMQTSSLIGDLVCAPLINAGVEGGLKALPPEWECTGEGLIADKKPELIAWCKELKFPLKN